MIRKIKTWLPDFPGFSESAYKFPDADIGSELFDDPENIDPKLRGLIQDALWDYVDYEQYENGVATAYVDAWFEAVKEQLPCIKGVEFENVLSGGINIILTVDWAELVALFENSENSVEYVKANYTSCSGFWSSYENTLPEWLETLEAGIEHKAGAILDCLTDTDAMGLYDYTMDNIYAGNYIQYDKLLESINMSLSLDHPLSKPIAEWSDIEDYEFTDVGNDFLQLLTGKGLYETDPEKMLITDFQDNRGLNKTN